MRNARSRSRQRGILRRAWPPLASVAEMRQLAGSSPPSPLLPLSVQTFPDASSGTRVSNPALEANSIGKMESLGVTLEVAQDIHMGWEAESFVASLGPALLAFFHRIERKLAEGHQVAGKVGAQIRHTSRYARDIDRDPGPEGPIPDLRYKPMCRRGGTRPRKSRARIPPAQAGARPQAPPPPRRSRLLFPSAPSPIS